MEIQTLGLAGYIGGRRGKFSAGIRARLFPTRPREKRRELIACMMVEEGLGFL